MIQILFLVGLMQDFGEHIFVTMEVQNNTNK